MIDKTGSTDREKQTLQIVLFLNAAIAIAFLLTRALGASSDLIGNGLDNLSDAADYGLSLVELRHGIKWQTREGTGSGARGSRVGRYGYNCGGRVETKKKRK